MKLNCILWHVVVSIIVIKSLHYGVKFCTSENISPNCVNCITFVHIWLLENLVCFEVLLCAYRALVFHSFISYGKDDAYLCAMLCIISCCVTIIFLLLCVQVCNYCASTLFRLLTLKTWYAILAVQ